MGWRIYVWRLSIISRFAAASAAISVLGELPFHCRVAEASWPSLFVEESHTLAHR
ncbi:hypothetical protein [uncultured Akkermansia sp.]|uniref:hypothetical protein n=1 Tax=uncultured Akkermansia sp. TaxID=512294 RepID=UPI00261CEFC1|nr:hypothetical protein [uncultured Akkermansia sp.]